MAENQQMTTEEMLHATFNDAMGRQAAACLARYGSLFLDQLLTDPRQMAEQNLVKQYLRQAGYEVRLVQNPEPMPSQAMGNPIDNILKE